MYSVRYRPQGAIPALRCGIFRSLFYQEKGHGVPAAWLGTKGTYPICLILRRRSIAPLSLSKSRGLFCDMERKRGKCSNTALLYSALNVRIALISFACSLSRISSSTPK